MARRELHYLSIQSTGPVAVTLPNGALAGPNALAGLYVPEGSWVKITDKEPHEWAPAAQRPSERGQAPQRPSERGQAPQRPSERGQAPRRGPAPQRPSERGPPPQRKPAWRKKDPARGTPAYEREIARLDAALDEYIASDKRRK